MTSSCSTAIETTYIACGVNRVSGCIAWGPEWLACGLHNAVGLAKISAECRQLQHTIVGHTGRINVLRWVYSDTSNASLLLSGASDKTVVIWERSSVTAPMIQRAVLKGHTASVDAVDGVLVSKTCLLVASAGGDSTICIWKVLLDEHASFECLQTITIPANGLCLCLRLARLPNDLGGLVLACGFDTSNVGLYVKSVDSQEFLSPLTLRGHEDWIRDLDFTLWEGELYLASCSQDCFIRVWRIHEEETKSNMELKENDNMLKVRPLHLCDGNNSRSVIVTLDGVLAGHEGWVLDVNWSTVSGRLELLSASMDKCMILWTVEGASGVWMDSIRVGDVGGNILGLLTCQFAPDGSMILAHGFQGGLSVWCRPDNGGVWPPGVSVGGHSSGAQDLSWEPRAGRYLLSTSLDQTVRLHAPWRQMMDAEGEWHEIARPQIHGYDMSAVACIDQFHYVSAGDEKVARVFTGPRNFRENLSRLTQRSFSEKELGPGGDEEVPQGAMVPALGLSNKAIKATDSQQSQLTAMMEDLAMPCEDVRNQYSQSYFRPQLYDSPPSEDNLLQNTLWPETKKLYAHGYEVYCLAAHPDGGLIASACKAAKPEHANILLWSTKDWAVVQSLTFHQLTVTQLDFSQSGRDLLAVSRDRSWSVWRRGPEGGYALAGHSEKRTGHSRIIWSGAWTYDDKYFITGSRDKHMRTWDSSTFLPASDRVLADAVTAVHSAPVATDNCSYLIGAGLEDGRITLLLWHPGREDCWTTLAELDCCRAHHATVRRLQFRPVVGRTEGGKEEENGRWIQFASCGMDGCVKVFSVDLHTLLLT